MFHFSRTPASIRFLCKPEDHGVIAEPVPAKTVLPDWFRKLPAVDKQHASATNNGLTVKRCMPFLDAMTIGLDPAARRDRAPGDQGRRPHRRRRLGVRPADGQQSRRPSGRRQSEGARTALQVPQLLVDPHAAGLELPVRAAAQPAGAALRMRRGHRRYRHLRMRTSISRSSRPRPMASTRSRKARRWCRSSRPPRRRGMLKAEIRPETADEAMRARERSTATRSPAKAGTARSPAPRARRSSSLTAKTGAG